MCGDGCIKEIGIGCEYRSDCDDYTTCDKNMKYELCGAEGHENCLRYKELNKQKLNNLGELLGEVAIGC